MPNFVFNYEVKHNGRSYSAGTLIPADGKDTATLLMMGGTVVNDEAEKRIEHPKSETEMPTEEAVKSTKKPSKPSKPSK